MRRVLLVEDDKRITTSLTEFLATEGYAVMAASGQREAMALMKTQVFDLVLLDICLDQGDGYLVCRAIKEQYTIPVIFLTASDDENSIVNGFDTGADDYITKPFKPRELLSRMENAFRRYGSGKSVLSVGNITMDVDKGIVKKEGAEIVLSALEYRILYYMLSNRGILLSREKLLEEIWDIAGDYVNDNTLTVYIKRIREKIEDDPAEPRIIKTVRGIGYRVDL